MEAPLYTSHINTHDYRIAIQPIYCLGRLTLNRLNLKEPTVPQHRRKLVVDTRKFMCVE